MSVESSAAVAMQPRGLVRPRLLSQLDSSRTSGLALVIAPAGFGKTTLLDQYTQLHPGPVASYRADPADATGGHTARRLTAAVRAALGRSAVSAIGDPTAELIAEVGSVADDADLVIVIDNVDCLVGTPGEEVVERLLAHRPSAVRVLIAGRRTPSLNLLRYEVAGFPAVVGAEQLRFRTWEVERLLAGVYDEPLPPDEVAVLTRRTGGWAAGLAMFHLSTRGRPLSARRRAVAALSGRWAAARDYLARNLLAGMGAELREFLVRTCVFDVVTGERADALLGTTGGAERLDELAHRYGLPVTVDGGAYTYHQVLRGHLAAALVEDLGEADAARWHARAGELVEHEGAYAEAVRCYARAGDWTAVRRLLAQAGADVVDSPDRFWDDLLPGWLVAEDPWLAYAEARRRLGHGQLDVAIAGFRQAEALFTDSEGRHRCLRDRRVAAIWLADDQPTRSHWSAWLRAATRRHPAAVAGEARGLDGPAGELVRLVAELLAGNVVAALAVRLGPAGDVVAASREPPRRPSLEPTPPALGLRLLRAALRLAQQPGGWLSTLGVPATTDVGVEAALELDRVGEEADAAGFGWLGRMARAARALGPDPDAYADALAVAAECERRGDRWGQVAASALACLHEHRHGRHDMRRLARLVADCRDLGAGVLQAWAQAFLALAAAAEGLPDAAAQARAAATLAGSAGVSAGQVAATAALARTESDRRIVLLREAESQGTSVGLPASVVRGWAGPASPAPDPVVVVREPPAPAPPPISIRCFGGFRMELGGEPVDTASVRARARTALRLLAMQAGTAVHREVLIEALWPDLTPVAATRNLQVTISALRGLLEPDCERGKSNLLVRTGDAYGIALPPDGYADTQAFTAAVRRWHHVRPSGDGPAEVEALRAALAAYGGELLPEDGPAEWVVEARERYHRQATQVASALAAAELAQGNVAEAIAAAEHCIGTLDPHDDDVWQVLLRAYPDSGAPAKAAEARRRYREMLASLGVDLSPVRRLPVQRSPRDDRAVPRRRP
jgi:DNA-binding SARP family transcriptional activator